MRRRGSSLPTPCPPWGLGSAALGRTPGTFSADLGDCVGGRRGESSCGIRQGAQEPGTAGVSQVRKVSVAAIAAAKNYFFCGRFRCRLNAKVDPSLSQLRRDGWLYGASLAQQAGAAAQKLAQGLWSARGIKFASSLLRIHRVWEKISLLLGNRGV